MIRRGISLSAYSVLPSSSAGARLYVTSELDIDRAEDIEVDRY